MEQADRAYFLVRASEERRAAELATTDASRRAHLAMAEECELRATDPRPKSIDDTNVLGGPPGTSRPE